MKNILVKIFGSRNQRILKDFNKILKDVNSFEQEFKTLGDLDFPVKTKELRSKPSFIYPTRHSISFNSKSR